MSTTPGNAEEDLTTRLDVLETRLEYLEAVLLDDVEPAASPAQAS
jgi:hypothetical protein